MPFRFFLVAALALTLAACGQEAEQTDAASTELTVYSGRSESLVEPLIERFEAATGIEVQVRYGDTAQLAVALTEEGDQTRADVFWAQDAGALGAVAEAGLLAPLPDSVLTRVPAAYRSPRGMWVGTSGRARTLAYAPARVDTTDLPQRLFDLTDPAYAGRVGWAPANGSFQAHVTALRQEIGEDSTRMWLEAMAANGAQAYPKNSAIIQAIADGEVDYGLPNHYYLYRFTSEDADFPVAQTYFAPGDPGNLVNVAGAGILQGAAHPDAARRFLAFLLSEEAQQYVADEVYEYPVVDGVEPATRLVARDRLSDLQAGVDLNELRDLEATLDLLREVGLL